MSLKSLREGNNEEEKEDEEEDDEEEEKDQEEEEKDEREGENYPIDFTIICHAQTWEEPECFQTCCIYRQKMNTPGIVYVGRLGLFYVC